MKTISEIDLKAKKYIIFDMDGTLIDSIGIWNRTDQLLIEKYGNIKKSLKEVQIERDDFLHKNKDVNQYLEYCEYIIKKYNLSITDKSELLDIRWKISNEILEKEVNYKPNAVETIKKFKELGYKVILATMTTDTQLNIYKNKNIRMMEQMDLEKTFDFIIGADNVKKKKPDSEIYLKILEHFNCDSNECIVFEDSLTGVMSCKGANIDCINVYDENADINRVKINELTDYSIKNYDEILKIIN